MTGSRNPRWSRQEQRNARIRELREHRDAPLRRRRRFQPVMIVAWFAGVAAIAGFAIWLGFLAFAPQLMAWVDDNPGWIQQGIVRDFVQWYAPEQLADTPKSDSTDRITVTVKPGTNDAEIGQLLADKGLIRSELAFQYAVQRAGRSGSLQAGTYDLSPNMAPSAIVGALRQKAGKEIVVRIGEGWRLEQIVGYLATTPSTMHIDEFASLVKEPPASLLAEYPFFKDLPVGRSLEGYIYPDTYRLDANWSARKVLERFLNAFQDHLTADITDGLAKQGISLDDAVTLASIVEREAVLDAERPLIAGVYVNRIKNPDNGETNGILNADPTLQYGQATFEHGDAPIASWGDIEWWPPLAAAGKDIGADWPKALAGYQTYLHAGLPPSPIAAPRASSLAAVAAPQGDNLYFVAGCPNGKRDGSHYFAKTFDAHKANIAKANKECAGQ